MAEKKSSEGEVETDIPPDDLRCGRCDGKSWRCNHWRIHDCSLCESHCLASKKAKAKNNKGTRKGWVVSETRRKNVKPLRGVKVAYWDPEPQFDDSEEADVFLSSDHVSSFKKKHNHTHSPPSCFSVIA
ncbi:hypothetical protein L6164_030890 [Bauhinia variegata]|uniref:Uncharacterized protein n=1 Tax=Bauhinia variegata TaxID=167791 RepID=A0ACB9LD39_BAUVA|nr:hypothetical protein L6164_030890 [Bauhinia variegata]